MPRWENERYESIVNERNPSFKKNYQRFAIAPSHPPLPAAGFATAPSHSLPLASAAGFAIAPSHSLPTIRAAAHVHGRVRDHATALATACVRSWVRNRTIALIAAPAALFTAHSARLSATQRRSLPTRRHSPRHRICRRGRWHLPIPTSSHYQTVARSCVIAFRERKSSHKSRPEASIPCMRAPVTPRNASENVDSRHDPHGMHDSGRVSRGPGGCGAPDARFRTRFPRSAGTQCAGYAVPDEPGKRASP